MGKNTRLNKTNVNTAWNRPIVSFISRPNSFGNQNVIAANIAKMIPATT